LHSGFRLPEAVAVLFELASEVNRSRDAVLAALLRSLGGTLGLLQSDAAEYLQRGSAMVGAPDEATIATLIADRASAKQMKNFAEADRIRKLLDDQGIVLKDSASGTTWERR
jgi:cysteinyl-tRNA synthetase